MGTNYYVEAPPNPWGDQQRLHVGKSSAGWVFHFEAHDLAEVKLTTTDEWRKFLDGMVANGPCVLRDEYGQEWSVEDFWEWVDLKKAQPSYGGDYTDEGNAFTRGEFC